MADSAIKMFPVLQKVIHGIRPLSPFLSNVSDEAILAAIISVFVVIIFNFILLSKKRQPVAITDDWQDFPLIDKEEISHDVRRFRFALPSKEHIMGIPIGQHVSLKFVGSEGEVQRSYTPTSSNDDKGFMDLVIKVYRPNDRFPKGGLMSQHLDSLKIGDTIAMRGPKGSLEYLGKGKFTITKNVNGKKVTKSYKKKNIGMIAGGTGITPMLQIIRDILKNPGDKTKLWLIFANQTESDILLRKELEQIDSNRLHLWYTLDNAPADWKYSKGFINTEMCKAHLPPASDDTMIYVCGPPPMIKFACEPAFKEIGITSDQWYAF